MLTFQTLNIEIELYFQFLGVRFYTGVLEHIIDYVYGIGTIGESVSAFM